MNQIPFCSGYHDSLQYHAFCDDRMFAARIFWTGSLWHHSVWLYDGKVKEIHNSCLPLTQSNAPYADVEGLGFSLSAPDECVTITTGSLMIKLTPRHTFDGPSPIGPGLHHPNMVAEVEYEGITLNGLGYCKRYDFRGEPIRHWGYRFFHGTLKSHARATWTADATFGLSKHAYFRIIDDDGTVLQAPSRYSCHRDDKAYATINGLDYELSFEELGVWQASIANERMDSLLTQRFGKIRLQYDGIVETGYGLNELCFGTLG